MITVPQSNIRSYYPLLIEGVYQRTLEKVLLFENAWETNVMSLIWIVNKRFLLLHYKCFKNSHTEPQIRKEKTVSHRGTTFDDISPMTRSI